MAGVLRLFVALYPPVEVAAAALGLLEGLGPLEPHRVTPVNQVHMTLQFVGETAERELPEVLESVRRSAAGLACFELKPTRLVTMPDRGDPRLIAMETDAPGPLLEVQQRLVKRLARKPGTGSRFVPHITLLRFDNTSQAARIDAPVSVPAFAVRAVVLVRSVLRTTGAEHVPVEVVELGPRR